MESVIVAVADALHHEFYLSLPLPGAVIRVCEAAEAFSILSILEVDLVLLDSGPRMEEGLHLLRNIKLSHPSVPVVFLAAEVSCRCAVRAFRQGARDFVGIPIDISELRMSVNCLRKIKRNSGEKRCPVLISECRSETVCVQKITSMTPASILRAIRFVENNLSSKLTIEMLADEARLSKFHFCRLFARHIGMTPMQFVTHLRIQGAKALIKSGNLTVTSISYKVGFDDLGNFIRQFKKFTGMTPSAYKRTPEA